MRLLVSADGSFLRFGFKPTGRAQVPVAVQKSVELTSTSPVTALAMALSLEQEPVSP